MQFAEAGSSKVVLDTNAGNKENVAKGDKKVVVPVAQFEAFKVYEDDEQPRQQYEQQTRPPLQMPSKLPKSVENNPYKIYKEQIGENRYVTKVELAEIARKVAMDKVRAACSPMSIEQQCEENVKPGEIVASRNSKDIFFEMEEYRASIYQYLREHEVSFFVRLVFMTVFIFYFFAIMGLH